MSDFEELTCPFCKESDFDKPGLDMHLEHYCIPAIRRDRWVKQQENAALKARIAELEIELTRRTL